MWHHTSTVGCTQPHTCFLLLVWDCNLRIFGFFVGQISIRWPWWPCFWTAIFAFLDPFLDRSLSGGLDLCQVALVVFAFFRFWSAFLAFLGPFLDRFLSGCLDICLGALILVHFCIPVSWKYSVKYLDKVTCCLSFLYWV
ncbi:hypothetical protein F5141DRAFT_1065484 [Pisolithus sp. B1]|nr:hypothetical protein F5141DRAFT_1065484 [Pisolithus sp. B1]